MRRLLTLLALAVGIASSFTGLHTKAQPQRMVMPPQMLSDAEAAPILVIVTVRADSVPSLDVDLPLFERQAAVDGAMNPVLTRHSADANPMFRRLMGIPSFRMLADRQQLEALAADPDVIAIRRDRPMKPSRLLTSAPFIGANTAWGGGLTGTDWTIAIIDTGVAQSHPFLQNKIVEHGCFGTTFPGISQTMCVGNVEQTFAEGSGAPCPDPGCEHGTHVAGIASGNSSTIKGVAPDAQLMSFQVFSRLLTAADCDPDPAPCIGAYPSDLSDAVSRIFFIRQNYRVVRPGGINPWHAATMIGAVNISLGSSDSYATAAQCDDAAFIADFGSLRSNDNRIPTVAAAGNFGLTGALIAPACSPSVISVGATQHTSAALWPQTNRASFLSLLAPGQGIVSSVPGGTAPGGDFVAMDGTSMATPHVSGAVTLLREHAPYTSVENILKTLQKTGDQVIEGANTFRMVRIDRALQVPFASDILTNTLVQTLEDTTLLVPLTLSDFDTPENNLIVTVTSANTAIVPNDAAHISVLGTGADRVISLTPLPNVNGNTTITYTVSDGPHDADTTPFLMTVAPVNDLPAIVPSSTNVAVAVNNAGQITVTVNDPDSPPSSLTLTATSLNQALLPNSNIAISAIGTAATSRTFQLTMTPATGQEGSSTVTLTSTDGAPGGLTATTTITFSAGAPAGAPTISAIADQSTNEGTPLTVNFTIGDPDTPLSSLTVTALSSNIAVVAAWGLVTGGTGADRTLQITPVNNASGNTTITVRVSDGSFIVQEAFVLTVTSINGNPVITGPLAATTTPGTAVTLTMTVTDSDTPGSSLTLTGASSNTALLPDSGITITPLATNPTSRTFNVRMAPVGTLAGQSIVTLTANDGAGGTSTANITLVVALSNTPPTISYIPNQTTTPNTPVGPIAFTVGDAETPAASLIVSGASSNQGLLPSANIVFGGSGATRTVTLTPAPNQLGTALVTINVSDGQQSSIMQFTFEVAGPPPDAPTSIAVTTNGNQVAVSWTRSLTGPAPASYVVEIGTAPGATTLPTQNTGNANTSLLLTLPDGTYYFRVRAVNTAGISGPSPETSAVVGTASLIPGPPSNFAVTTVGLGAVFTWSPPTVGGPVTSYVIEAGTGPGLANIATLVTGSAATSYHLPSVPLGTYYVRVRGRNTIGTGAPSQDVAFTMGGATCSTAPGSPVQLPPVVAAGQVTLSWIAPASGSPPTSYVVLAGTAPGLTNIASFDTLSASTGFSAPAPIGTYFVRVASRNPCGDSPPSNEMSFTIGTTAPGAPSGLVATVSPGGVVGLNWVAPATGGAPTGYIVDAGTATGLSNVASIPTGSTVTGFSGVAPPGTYFVRVRAINAGGSGPPSNEVVVVVP